MARQQPKSNEMAASMRGGATPTAPAVPISARVRGWRGLVRRVLGRVPRILEAMLPWQGRVQRHAVDTAVDPGLERLKDLQWELAEREARYRDLLDRQSQIIVRMGADGRLKFVNRAYCLTFNTTLAEAVGGPLPFTISTDRAGASAGGADAEPSLERFEQAIETASGLCWFAFERQRVTASDAQGVEIQLTGRDITEERRIQHELAAARDAAEAASRAKSRFLAAMSHEIRTPMNGILGMSALLAETPLNAEQRTYAAAIDQSSRTLLRLIDEILDFSKIEAGRFDILAAPFAIDECVESAVELLYARAVEKRLGLAWTIAAHMPRMLIGDGARVRQIVLNLVGNAIKFTDRGGIAVRIAARAERLVIEVTDTGIGIPPATMGVLFGEFEQAEETVRSQRGGTGLGLAISRRLARAMGGDIEAASTPGCGSTFRLILPLCPAEGSAPALVLPAAPRPQGVIVAVAGETERQLLCETLNEMGLVTHVLTPCGSDASRWHGTGQCADVSSANVLMVDGSIAPEDAGAWLRQLRERPGGVGLRGIVIVEPHERSTLAAYRDAGFDAYLVRPVRPRSLLTRLSTPPDAGPASGAADQRDVTCAPALVRVAGRRRILLAEDNAINALLARRMMERCGCVVQQAANGREAIARVLEASSQGVPFDLVLMDVMMPEMDGLEAAQHIRRALAERGQPVPPIVALTANAFEEDRRRCLDGGMDDYLAKPFEPVELAGLLRRWCGESEVGLRDGQLQ